MLGSYQVFFGFSTGLSKPVTVPEGTTAACVRHVAKVARTLKLKTTQYKDNPRHWDSFGRFNEVPDDVLCSTALRHNAWVRDLYANFGAWMRRRPRGPTEKMTPEAAAKFWHGLELLSVSLDRWTDAYYTDRMAHAVRVMTSGEDEGVTWGTRRLSRERAEAVVSLFSLWMGTSAVRRDPFKVADDTSHGAYRYAYVGAMEHTYAVLRGHGYPLMDSAPAAVLKLFNDRPLTIAQAAGVVWLFADWLDKNDMRLAVPVGYDHLCSSYDGGYEWCETHGPIHPDDRCRGKRCELGRETAEMDARW